MSGSDSEILERNGGKVISRTADTLLKWGLGGVAFAFVAYMSYLMLTFIMGGQATRVQSIEAKMDKMIESQAWNNKLTSDLLEVTKKSHTENLKALEEIKQATWRRR